MKVRRFQLDGGRPVVPGAAFVLPGKGGLWFAEFPGPDGRVGEGGGGHATLAELGAPGLFVWQGIRGAPDLGGEDFDAWARSAAGRAVHRHYRVTGSLPARDNQGNPVLVDVTDLVVRLPAAVPAADASDAAPWSLAGATITKAVPALRAVAGAIRDEDIGGRSPRHLQQRVQAERQQRDGAQRARE